MAPRHEVGGSGNGSAAGGSSMAAPARGDASKRTQPLILGAGLPRTGTRSTKYALQWLLQGNVHHMEEVIARRDLVRKWHAREVLDQPMDWQALMGEFKAAVDFPVSAYMAEVYAAFPDALVVLTVRDSPEAWWRSYSALMATMRAVTPLARAVRVPGDLALPMLRSLHCRFADVEEPGVDEAAEIAAYIAHNEAMKALVPADRLLVFNVKQGWGPLLAFFDRHGVQYRAPEPGAPFPRCNESGRGNITRWVVKLAVKGYLLHYAAGLALLVLAGAGLASLLARWSAAGVLPAGGQLPSAVVAIAAVALTWAVSTGAGAPAGAARPRARAA